MTPQEDVGVVGNGSTSPLVNPGTGLLVAMHSSVQFVSWRDRVWAYSMLFVFTACTLISILALSVMVLTGDFRGGGAVLLFILPAFLLFERALLTVRALMTSTHTARGSLTSAIVVDTNQMRLGVAAIYNLSGRPYPLLSLHIPSENMAVRVLLMREGGQAFHLIGNTLRVCVSANKGFVTIIGSETGSGIGELLNAA